MAYIKTIRFAHVGRNEGCLCDKCGTYIQNIVTVDYDFGSMNYGQDCFAKMYNSGRLTATGVKLIKEIVKKTERYTREREKYESGEMTAENDIGYQSWQPNNGGWFNDGYWTGKPYDEYKQWMLDVWYPERFKEIQKQIDRFKKVNFNA